MASAAGARRRTGKGSNTATTSLLDLDDRPILKGARARSKSEHYAESSTQLSIKHWIVIGAHLVILLLFLIRQHLYVPEPLPTDAPENVFSEGRARVFLDELASYGFKPAGSEACEVKSFNLIIRTLEKIKSNANSAHTLEIDVQRPDGCYHMPRLGDFSLCYKKVVNIIARLGSSKRGAPSEHSILINCHFDSWPDSPGASDDGSSCAVMLEMLRAYTTRNEAQPHDLIFLFNGAEENILMAAHGFITQHPWRHSIRTFVNLEGAGSGGREILFQTGPGNEWLLHTYLDAAPHPHCSVMAQEVFEAGLVPGDTDFRIFRDHGKLSGLDFAYVHNHYVYHTEFDTPKFITQGTLQRAGENTLALVDALVRSPYLVQPGEYHKGRSIFFDVAGLFTIAYSYSWGVVFNMLAVALFVVKVLLNTTAKETVKGHPTGYTLAQILIAFALHIITNVIMLAGAYACKVLLVELGASMCWYATHTNAILVYVIPPMLVGIVIHTLARSYLWSNKIPSAIVERCVFDAHIMWNALMISVLQYYSIASAFFWLILAISGLVRAPLLRVASCGMSDTSPLWRLLCTLIALLPSSTMIIYSNYSVLNLFIPIMGRSLTHESEIPVMLSAWSASIGLMMSLSSLVYVSSRCALRKVIYSLAAIVVLSFAAISLTSLGQPFHWDENAPRLRRVHLQHMTRRQYAHDDSEIENVNMMVIAPQDHRGYKDWPKEGIFAEHNAIECQPEWGKFCNMPYYVPVTDLLPPRYLRYFLVPEPPNVPLKTKLQLLEKREVRSNAVNMTFYVEGSDHLSLQITPQNGWHLKRWSFENTKFDRTQSTFIYLAYGTMPTRVNEQTKREEQYGPWTFWIILEHPNKPDRNKNALQLGAASQFVHGPPMHSDRIKIALSEIHRRRADPRESWRWAMTVDAWTVDMEIRQYQL